MEEYVITAKAVRGTAVGYLCLWPDGSDSFVGMKNCATPLSIGDGWMHLHRLREDGNGSYSYQLELNTERHRGPAITCGVSENGVG